MLWSPVQPHQLSGEINNASFIALSPLLHVELLCILTRVICPNLRAVGTFVAHSVCFLLRVFHCLFALHFFYTSSMKNFLRF